VTSDVPEQKVPVMLLQIDGGVGQEQLADGKDPEQGLFAGQPVDAALIVHPSPPTEQVSSVNEAEQYEPAPFSHPAGGVGQTQCAFGD
jgi:hypothetical protein